MEKIEDLSKGVKKNVSLKNYTTFKIGGNARYFFTAETKKNLVAAISAVKKINLPFFILGAGSNLLVSDKGFPGIIIKIENCKLKIKNSGIVAEAGIKLPELLRVSTKNGLAGLEWAAGIPGTVGGAIFGNAGAFGRSMGDIIDEVEVLDVRTKKIIFLNNKNCGFGYRKSIFKKNKNLIILSAKMKFQEDDKKIIKNRLQKFLKYRKESQPLGFPSAGSVFTNPGKFFAGKLIEKCGLKGKKIGGAGISKKHANFIVNLDAAKAEDVKKLINFAKKSVKNKFGVNLHEEIQYVGF